MRPWRKSPQFENEDLKSAASRGGGLRGASRNRSRRGLCFQAVVTFSKDLRPVHPSGQARVTLVGSSHDHDVARSALAAGAPDPRAPAYHPIRSRQLASGVGYFPLKHAEQNERPSGSPAAACNPGSDRYPSESAVTYRAISSTVCEAAISSCRLGVSMP